MPFGLTNTLVAFMDLMNIVFCFFLDQFVVVFIDNILIYSQSKIEHEEYLRMVYKLYRKNNFMINLVSVNFGKTKLYFWDISFQ